MRFNVSKIKTDVSRRVSPSSPNDSRDFYGALETSANTLLSVIKPKELSKRVIVENALYDQVNKYNCPEDLDTNKIMQWYRLKGNQSIDRFFARATQVTNRAFDDADVTANGASATAQELFTIEYQSGVKFIKVRTQMPFSGLTIHKMDDLTSNGSWNTFGNVVNLTEDNLTYVTGTGSLRFDMNTSSNTGGIENFTIKPVDITEYLNVGKVFTWLNLQNANQIQTVTLDMFSSPTDYYSITVNSPHDTDRFQLDQNLLGFTIDQDTMNTIGTPNPANINHIRFTFTTDATMEMKSVRMDNVVARKGEVFGFQYISNQMFHDVESGYWKFRPTVDSDIIHLEYDTYELLLDILSYELANELLTDNQGRRNVLAYEKKMKENMALYKKRHKEEFIDETQVLRNFGVPYGIYNGRGFNNDFSPLNRNA